MEIESHTREIGETLIAEQHSSPPHLDQLLEQCNILIKLN
jgi:hypothetical protein